MKLDENLKKDDTRKFHIRRRRYRCKKCGYTSPRTFLIIFEDQELRFCLKCVSEFFQKTFPRAVPVEKLRNENDATLDDIINGENLET